MKNIIITFLKSNGFYSSGEVFCNTFCKVDLSNDKMYIDGINGRRWKYSKLSIYWLIGVLTTHNLVKEDFKRLSI